MSWGMVAVAGGSLLAGYLGSESTKEQAEIQANSITEAGEIDSAARNQAISQVLEMFSPSLAQFNESMQGSIDLLESGRISTGELLTQSANNMSQIAVQGGQQALNALLGTSTQATPGTQPAANQPQAQLPAQTLPVDAPPVAPQTGGIIPSDLATQPVPGEFGQGTAPQGIAPPQDLGPGQQFNPQTGEPWNVSEQNRDAFLDGPSYGPIQGPEQFPNQNQLPTPGDPLTGELMPRDYNFQQGNVNLPQGNFGLAGTEQAINQGADLGRANLMQGAQSGLERLGSRFDTARGDVVGGRDFALNKVQQAIQASRQGINQGVGSIQQGTRAGVNAINAGVDRGVGFLSPYMSAGQEALDPLAALSGLRGQEAFDAARINHPAYQALLDSSERSIGRNAAITNKIGSGNVMARLQENAQTLTAGDIERQLGGFRDIRNSGQSAASQAGQFTTQGGIASGNLEAQGGINVGQMQGRGGELEAGLLSRAGDIGIQSSAQLSQIAQQLGMTENQVLNMLGSNLSNVDVGTGMAIGGARETAGTNAANIIQGTTGQQVNIEGNLAQSLAGLDQNTINNIVNSIQQGAGTNLDANQQLSTLLANLGIGAGTSAAGYTQAIGTANAAGVTNPWGNAINTGIGLYADGAFDTPYDYNAVMQDTNNYPPRPTGGIG